MGIYSKPKILTWNAITPVFAIIHEKQNHIKMIPIFPPLLREFVAEVVTQEPAPSSSMKVKQMLIVIDDGKANATYLSFDTSGVRCLLLKELI